MKKLLLFLVITLSFGQLSAQKNVFWKKISENDVKAEKITNASYSQKQQLLTIDVQAVKQKLSGAASKLSGKSGVQVSFPDVDGNIEKFQVWENSNFDAALQAQYPEIRAYVGKSISDPGTIINFSVSPKGIETMTLRADGSTEFIEPYTKDNTSYVLFDSKTRATGKLPFNCSTKDAAVANQILEENATHARASNQSYKTMRLALSCTAEYTTFHGGTVVAALAAMNATMTRVNGVFEKDMALHLNIIAQSTGVIYTNASTDPYSTPSIGMADENEGTLLNWNIQLQNTLTTNIGNANYDIGHLFGASGGGGNAGCIGCVCVDDTLDNNLDENKGSGYTSPSNGIPRGDTFDIDFVIHEMGHQLGANHTFSYRVEGNAVNVEPGSGSTIMGYAGVTDGFDVQPNSDPYFTYRSILQVETNLGTKTCPVSTPIANTPPVITPLVDFTVPKGTPFILKGNATDAEGDVLSYCWEQNNNAPGNQIGANSKAYPTKATGPNYRSFLPVSTPNRYMPAYSSVLNGVLSTDWESVSTVQRSSRYTLTVRDNNATGAQTSTDDVTVITSGSIGPFQLTSPAPSTSWVQGTPQTITWDVNNANTLPGAELVNIKLSTDGGITFPYILAENTQNDGSYDVIVPDVASQTCRILIEPTGHAYYTIGTAPFYIGYELVKNCQTYDYSGEPFAIPDGVTSYTFKNLNIPAIAGSIADVNIKVNITHPNLQNIRVGVIKPSGGGFYTLFNQQCPGNANLDVTFDSQAPALVCGNPTQGTYAPALFNLDTFNGTNPQGTWQFGFRDTVAGGTGTVNSFSLELCTQVLVRLATEEFRLNDFAIYPNPNNGNFTVQFNSKSGSKINIAVHDISGRKILDNTYDNTGLFSKELQLNKAQAGIYLVSVTDGGQKTVKRIVVE